MTKQTNRNTYSTPKIITHLGQAQKAHTLARSLWTKACVWDGIDPKSKFVCFSAENPYAIHAGRAAVLAIRLLQRL